MVEANPYNFPPLPEDEPQLLEYLEYLVKDRLIPGVDRLLDTRV